MLKRFLEETTTKQLHLTVFCQAFPNIFESFLLQFWWIEKNFKKKKKNGWELDVLCKKEINQSQPFHTGYFRSHFVLFLWLLLADFNAHDFLIVIQQLS